MTTNAQKFVAQYGHLNYDAKPEELIEVITAYEAWLEANKEYRAADHVRSAPTPLVQEFLTEYRETQAFEIDNSGPGPVYIQIRMLNHLANFVLTQVDADERQQAQTKADALNPDQGSGGDE